MEVMPNPINYQLSHLRKIVKSNHEWDTGNANSLKEVLRKHLEKEFEKKCFYCQREINIGNASPEIDHILYKDKYKYFTFRPENLVWSCKLCNTIKGTDDVFTPSTTLIAPGKLFKNYSELKSENFNIIHAYFDKHSDHIELKDNLFPIAKNGSTKGENTIETCKLYRLSLAEDRIRESINVTNGIVEALKSKNFDDIIEEYTKKLKEENQIYDVIKSQDIKDITYQIVKLNGKNVFNHNSNYLLHYLEVYLEIITSYIALVKNLSTSKTFKNALNEYKNSLGLSIATINDFLDYEMMTNFKSEYEGNNIKEIIHSTVKDTVFKSIDHIYGTRENFKRLKFLLKKKSEIKEIIKIVGNKNIKKNIVEIEDKLIVRIEDISELLEKYIDISDYFYSINLIPILKNWTKSLESNTNLYENLKRF